jgi:hypothetical protein
MDYQKIHNQIIERAKTRQLDGYKERHHIIPKCMGGSNDKSNLVELTAREHFLCHILLCEIYPNEYKLRHALFLMAIGKQKIREKTYVISSRTYERLKIEYSEMLTGKFQSQETKDRKSKSMSKVWNNKTKKEISEIGHKIWETRRKNGNDKIQPEHAEKISQSLKGRKITWDRKRDKPIFQFDLEGKFIKEWPSIAEAKRQVGGDIKSVIAGRQKTAAGFIWKIKN